MPPLDPAVLPPVITSRMVPGVNGLDVHVLEAGPRLSRHGCSPGSLPDEIVGDVLNMHAGQISFRNKSTSTNVDLSIEPWGNAWSLSPNSLTQLTIWSETLELIETEWNDHDGRPFFTIFLPTMSEWKILIDGNDVTP